jgi:hypothetical protein
VAQIMSFRIFCAFFLAPLLPCVLFALPVLLERDGWIFPIWLLGGAEIIVVIAAIPSYLIWRRFSRFGIRQSVQLGAAIGAAFSVIMLLLPLALYPDSTSSYGDGGGYVVDHGRRTLHGWIDFAEGLGLTTVFGASIGLVFGCLAFGLPRTRKAQPT